MYTYVCLHCLLWHYYNMHYIFVCVWVSVFKEYYRFPIDATVCNIHAKTKKKPATNDRSVANRIILHHFNFCRGEGGRFGGIKYLTTSRSRTLNPWDNALEIRIARPIFYATGFRTWKWIQSKMHHSSSLFMCTDRVHLCHFTSVSNRLW